MCLRLGLSVYGGWDARGRHHANQACRERDGKRDGETDWEEKRLEGRVGAMVGEMEWDLKDGKGDVRRMNSDGSRD